MSRIDAILEELERVGADEFCRRRFEREDMPLKLMRDLARVKLLTSELTIERLKGNYSNEMTSRRLEVLKLVAEGYRDREIADALVVAVDTVKSHVRVILANLDARNRTHAVHLAHLKHLL